MLTISVIDKYIINMGWKNSLHRYNKSKMWIKIWTTVWTILTFGELVHGCILLLNGWQPLSVGKKALLADIAVSGYARRTFKNVRTDADTYTAEFHVFTVLKGHKKMRKISVNSNQPGLYNISNFGDKTMCYADVNQGESYILFLTTFQGKLSAKYDDIFGAATDYNVDSELDVLQAIGWKPWSSWSPCSRTCRGGIQIRKRKCTKKNFKNCDGSHGQQRTCNNFKCRGAIDVLSGLSINKLPQGVSIVQNRPSAFHFNKTTSVSAFTSSLLNEKYFPQDFSIIVTARPQAENQGTIFTIADASGHVTRLGIHVGINPVFEYRDHNGQPGFNSPNFFINLSDGEWHQFAYSVRGGSVTLYVDCAFDMTRALQRSSMPQIGVNTIMTLGSMVDAMPGEHFEGDIQQLIITSDVTAASKQCGKKVSSINEASIGPSKEKIDDEGTKEITQALERGNSLIQTDQPGSGDNGGYGWSSWSPCSSTCGSGVRTRSAYCLDNTLTVDECVDDGSNPTESEKCFLQNCPEKCRLDCHNGGRCENQRCICPYGYNGNICEKVACRMGCLNGGFCLKPHQCACPSGYSGRRCEKAMCDPPCEHGGNCVAPGVCSCPWGFAPPRCKPICKRPCYNQGTCVGANRCRCKLGYHGDQCQLGTPVVAQQPSQPTCRYGCYNGGRCVAPDRCACMNGYTGDRCQTAVCYPSCQFGGTCIRPHVCMCKQGTYGAYCQKYSCARGCLNGGSCVGPNQCQCPQGYSGSYCQTMSCTVACQNGGTCLPGNRCRCVNGYFGTRCERKKCQYELYNEPYQRGYRKLVKEQYRTNCGAYGWNTCLKTRSVYKMIYRTFYRPAYRCV